MVTTHAFTLMIDIDNDRYSPEDIQEAIEYVLQDLDIIEYHELDYAGEVGTVAGDEDADE